MSLRSLALGTLAAGGLFVAAAAADPQVIAIANFGEHPQLNATVEGFKAALADQGFKEGEQVVYSVQHTNFDGALLPQMIAALQAENPVLFFTVTTPVSQAAQTALAGSGVPIVFGAVTDPVAAKLTPSWDAGGPGITGASDLQDIAAVMKFTHELLPKATRLGLPYNPGEANDVALLEKMKAAAPAAGFEIVEVGIDNTNDIPQRIASLRDRVDAIYVPGSNLIQPAIASVASAAREIGVPIVNSDATPVVEGQVLAAFAIDYAKVGYNAGLLAAQVLNGADPATLAPTVPAYEDHAATISKRGLAEYGVALPASLANCNCLVE